MAKAKKAPVIELHLHATTHAKLSALANSYKIELIELCTQILNSYYKHMQFRSLAYHASELPQNSHVFTPGAKAIPLEIPHSLNGMKLDAEICAELLAAYAIGLANRDHKLLRDLPVEVKLSLFTIPFNDKE